MQKHVSNNRYTSNGSVAKIRMTSETPEKREALTTTKVTKYSGIW
jgi:hypothetical protein